MQILGRPYSSSQQVSQMLNDMHPATRTLLLALTGPVLCGLALAAIEIGAFRVSPFDPQDEPSYIVAMHWILVLGTSFGMAAYCYRQWEDKRLALPIAIVIFLFGFFRTICVAGAWFMKLAACCCCEDIPSWVWVINATLNPTYPFMRYSMLY